MLTLSLHWNSLSDGLPFFLLLFVCLLFVWLWSWFFVVVFVCCN